MRIFFCLSFFILFEISSSENVTTVPIIYDPTIYAVIPQNGAESTCNTEVLQTSIISSYTDVASMHGVDLDNSTQLSSIKDAVNQFYGVIYQSKNYNESIEPNVNASTTFAQVIDSLGSLLREPTEIYASYTSDDAPGFSPLTGNLYCGEDKTKVHIIPSTTGLSEVGGLRDALNSVLPTFPPNQPSVLSLVNDSMGNMDMFVLPLTNDGNNFLLNDLSLIQLEYTFIHNITNPSIPISGLYTAGDVTGNGLLNWQDIKGVKLEFEIALTGDFYVDDKVTFQLNADSCSSTLQSSSSSSNSATSLASTTLLYRNEQGEDEQEAISSLSELQLLTVPVSFGNQLGLSQLAVFIEFVGNADSSIVVSEFLILAGNNAYNFSPSSQS